MNLKRLKFSVFGVFRGTIKFNNTFTVSKVAVPIRIVKYTIIYAQALKTEKQTAQSICAFS